ncbi:DUF5825 family protein [Streptomyces sp. KS_5]|uniref:DUF5825 family protein n=1 Tax=Streptomyces TaxID=1883 RepID=UPI0035234138
MSRHRVIPCELANRLRRSAVARTSRHAVHARSRSRRSVALLRDARGVGLRVSWSGECGDLDVRCLQYLDPPRQPDGTLAWSPRADAQLLARRGPTFISVDDTRHGPRRRIVIDRSTPEANVLEAVDWGRDHDHGAPAFTASHWTAWLSLLVTTVWAFPYARGSGVSERFVGFRTQPPSVPVLPGAKWRGLGFPDFTPASASKMHATVSSI